MIEAAGKSKFRLTTFKKVI